MDNKENCNLDNGSNDTTVQRKEKVVLDIDHSSDDKNIPSEHHKSHHHSSHHSHHGSHHHSTKKHHKHSYKRKKKKELNLKNTTIMLLLSCVMMVIVMALVIWFDLNDTPPIINDYTGEVNTDFTKPSINTTNNILTWDKPIYDANIPVFQLSEEKPSMTEAERTPDAIYAMYDALMEKYPHYITKTDLGLCSDGVNHVYRYDFKDPDQRHYHDRRSETKAKAILVSGIHYEWAGIFSLFYALEEITENPELRDLRRNVHLIVVPCASPFTTIIDNIEISEGQKNANGVEVHQNFEVGFIYPGQEGYEEPGTTHHGGTTPLSEVETQYLDNILQENADAAFFLTCHNMNVDQWDGVSFIWGSVGTPYMCNMAYRIIDKMSQAWMDKYADILMRGLEEYRTEALEPWDTRLGWAQISINNGTETRQATKYGIQAANLEVCDRFWVHGTKDNREPWLSSFTMSRGAEVYVNFLLTAFGVYDPTDKLLYGAIQ